MALLGAFIASSDLRHVADCFRLLGWTAPVILLPEAVVLLADTFGWRSVMPAAMRERVPVPSLYLIRMAGEAVNGFTPTATVGGEPVKAHLLRAFGIAGSEAMATVVVARTALVASQAAFVTAGTIALLAYLGYHRLAAVWLAVQGLAAVAFVVALVRVQQRGLATATCRLARRLAPHSQLVARLEASAAVGDQRLDEFHRLEQPAFRRAMAWHFTGWLLGTSEIQLIMWLTGAPVGFVEALLIESLAQPIRAAALVIPGALGAQEWGGLWLCTMLGMAEPHAVVLWLLKRARETAFDAVGLAYLGKRTYVDRTP
jgi:putative membrane protein